MATEAEVFAAVDRLRIAIKDVAAARRAVQEASELRTAAVAQLSRANEEVSSAQGELAIARQVLKDLLNA